MEEQELTLNIILSLTSSFLMLTLMVYMIWGFIKDKMSGKNLLNGNNKLLTKRAKRTKIAMIGCLVIAGLEYITLDSFNCTVWIFNSSIWMVSYFNTKELADEYES